MRLKFATIFAAALLLSACASQPKTTADTTGGGMTSTDTQTATETTEPAETTEIGVVPGTQEDLVVNVGDRVFFDFDKYRSEEHTSELQSLMRISYAVFCLQKNNNQKTTTYIY